MRPSAGTVNALRKPELKSFLLSVAIYVVVILRYLGTDVEDDFFDHEIEGLAWVIPVFLLFDLVRLVRIFGSGDKNG